MQILFHPSFNKSYHKLSKKLRDKVEERIMLFRRDKFNQLLNNHGLSGKYKDCRSINITGDYRAIYKEKDGVVVFILVDTHSNLYK